MVIAHVDSMPTSITVGTIHPPGPNNNGTGIDTSIPGFPPNIGRVVPVRMTFTSVSKDADFCIKPRQQQASNSQHPAGIRMTFFNVGPEHSLAALSDEIAHRAV